MNRTANLQGLGVAVFVVGYVAIDCPKRLSLL